MTTPHRYSKPRRRSQFKFNYLRLFPGRLLFIKLLTLSLIILSLAYLADYAFTITHITCQSNLSTCPPAVVAELDRLAQQNILTQDLDAITRKIQNSLPSISSIQPQFTPPGHLSITLTQSPQLALITPASHSAFLVVNHMYQITDQLATPTPDLNTIIYPDSRQILVGDSVSTYPLKAAVDLATTLANYFIFPQHIYLVSPIKTQVRLNNNITAFFDLHQDVVRQVKSLYLILAKINQPDSIETIDLRPSKPVIKRPTPPPIASPSASLAPINL